jgi:hypothetical protein
MVFGIDRSIGREYLGIASQGRDIDTAQFRQTERRQLAHGGHANGSTAGGGQKAGEITAVRQAAIDGDRVAYGGAMPSSTARTMSRRSVAWSMPMNNGTACLSQ